jgi:hypothetical protein
MEQASGAVDRHRSVSFRWIEGHSNANPDHDWCDEACRSPQFGALADVLLQFAHSPRVGRRAREVSGRPRRGKDGGWFGERRGSRRGSLPIIRYLTSFAISRVAFGTPALFWGSEHLLQSAAALGHSMKTGEASFVHVFGESFWVRIRRLPKENELFNRALADFRGDEHQQIADAYDWEPAGKIL